ncbi:cytidylate kinase-like family protein [Marinitenerispora sediminis]|uniref:Cytidylate kinase n=1 Tax=Marinitenerispora sediminis TaxID=1931232 RepID=A0A368T8W3_9ACTN|nr:cytidylate kinase-like family protein [Marinitenerispora sediminis]RCV53259.1 cytidylate kinase [Marinitenerispora sediminis]RCV56140.1 cytidylate kinase [Marinitenerispora sediminis]RCV60871.1 cytidylate kinase [Marinitenerispora sediminis]
MTHPSSHVVTISATYGAGGSVIGPTVARRLGVPFVDRAIPGAVAHRIGCSLEDALEHDDRAPIGLERLLASAARMPSVTLGSIDTTFIGATDSEGRLLYDKEFVEHTERVIAQAGRTGGVVLGRAGAVVLADHATALHVRLDGPKRRRLARAAAMREESRGEALRRGDEEAEQWRPPTMRELEDNDRARAAYVRRFYRADAADPRLYHLVVDSTAIGLAACVDAIERLARDRAAARAG